VRQSQSTFAASYDKQVWMESGKVYKVMFEPMTTSNYFDTGHRIRVEVRRRSRSRW